MSTKISTIHTVSSIPAGGGNGTVIGHFSDEGHAKATAHKYNTNPGRPTNFKAIIESNHALETEDGFLLLKSATAIKATEVSAEAQAHLSAVSSGLAKLTPEERTALGIKS